MAFAGYKRLSLAVSPAIACDPSKDLICLFSVSVDSGTTFGSGGGCYGPFGQAFWSSIAADYHPNGTTITTAAEVMQGAFAMGGKTYDPKYACSSANVLTPNFKGGNLMPVYWADQATTAAKKSVDDFIDLGKFIELCGTIGILGIVAGAVVLILGVVCVVMGNNKSKVTAAA